MPNRSNKLYNLVLRLLQGDPALRDSDKKLLWKVWEAEGRLYQGSLSYGNWLSPGLTTPESVTRCRRKIQELHHNLQGSLPVQQRRRKKQQTKGTFVFHEVVDPITNQIISYRKEEV